jgi:hypothetical protein
MPEFVFEKVSNKGNKCTHEKGYKGRNDGVSKRSMDYSTKYKGERKHPERVKQ